MARRLRRASAARTPGGRGADAGAQLAAEAQQAGQVADDAVGKIHQGRGLGAAILLPQGLLHPEVLRHAREQGKNPVHEALLGGEDYALLGSCAPDMLPSLHAAIPGFCSIGTVTDGGGLTCNNEPLDRLRGFDHFEAEKRAD